MERFDINKIADLHSCIEYQINKFGKVASLSFYRKNINTKYLTGEFELEVNLILDDEGYKYFYEATCNTREGRYIHTTFYSKNLFECLSKVTDYIEYKIENENKKGVELSLNAMIHRYDNSDKVGDEFIVRVHDNIELYFDKSLNVFENKSDLIVRDAETGDIKLTYTISGDTIFSVDSEEDGYYSVSFNQISGDYSGVTVDLDNFSATDEQGYSEVANIASVPANITITDTRLDINSFDIIYASYENGLLSDATTHDVRYEATSGDVEEKYESLHQLFYDMFDRDNAYSHKNDKWCIDEIDKFEDGEKYYTRTTYVLKDKNYDMKSTIEEMNKLDSSYLFLDPISYSELRD